MQNSSLLEPCPHLDRLLFLSLLGLALLYLLLCLCVRKACQQRQLATLLRLELLWLPLLHDVVMW